MGGPWEPDSARDSALGAGTTHGSSSRGGKEPACLPGLEVRAVLLPGKQGVGGVGGGVPRLCARVRAPERLQPTPDHCNFQKVLFTPNWTLPAHLSPAYRPPEPVYAL